MTFDIGKVDLDTLSSEDEQDQFDPSLRTTMDEAFKVNPEQHARTNQLSQQTGVPEFAVQSDPDAVERSIKLDNIDFVKMSQSHPLTSKHLGDFNKAVVSQDDIDVLQNVESAITGLKRSFEGTGESIGIGFDIQGKGTVAAGIESGPKKIDDIVPMSALPMGMEFLAPELSREVAGNMGVSNDEQFQQLQSEAVEGLVSDIAKLQERRKDITPADLNTFQQGIRAGWESMVINAPGIALALASGGRAAPALSAMYVQTAGGSYGCLLYTSPSPRDQRGSRMPSSA